MKGEKIEWEGRPLPGLKKLLFFRSILGLFFFLLFFSPFILFGIIAKASGSSAAYFIAGFGFLFLLALVVFLYVSAVLVYKKEYYWITNKRLIQKKGFIGYKVNSVPLERVSDVIISHSFLETLFGISSLQIQSLAGQYSRGRAGSEGNMRAVANPEKLQTLIFDLVRKNRKSEKLAI
jgi:uncharacterized membrane protein YdbT with pleckstrin-like domain